MSTNDRPSCFFNNIQAFSKRGRRKNCAAFLHDPVGPTSRHVRRTFRAKNRISDLPVFNIEQNLAKQLDPIQKTSHLKEITCLTHCYEQKSECPRRF